MPPGSSELLPLIGSAVHAVNVVLEWLMTYAIHSTILIGSLLLLTSTEAGRRLVTGHGSWLWRFALVGALITSSLQSLRSVSPIAGTLRVDGDTPARTMVKVEIKRENVTAPTSGAGRVRMSRRESVASSIQVSPSWPIVLFGAWALLAATLLGWFLVARARFMRSIGPRTSATHTLAGNSLRHLLRESRLTDVRLTVSDRLTSPVALSADEICLPSRAMSELGPVRITSILAHELAHLVRRDPAWLTIARVIEAIFFFQPLNILARRRMQESAEFASDAWASTRVARPLDLAHCLARVAEWTIAAPRFPVPAMTERRGPALVRRVERLTTGRVIPEVVPGRALRLAAVATLVGLILLAPRAAIGAERPVGGLFDTRVPRPAGIFMLREPRPPGVSARRTEDLSTVVVRVQRH